MECHAPPDIGVAAEPLTRDNAVSQLVITVRKDHLLAEEVSALPDTIVLADRRTKYLVPFSDVNQIPTVSRVACIIKVTCATVIQLIALMYITKSRS